MKPKKTILVVDDEATIREVVRRYLELEGFQVYEAADGFEALDAIKAHQPDLLVLDLMLPGIDGLSLTQHLRQDREIPIIMLLPKAKPATASVDWTWGRTITSPSLSARRRWFRGFGQYSGRVDSTTMSQTQKPISFDRLVINPVSHEVMVDGETISLTAKEFELLLYFAQTSSAGLQTIPAFGRCLG